MRGSRHRVPSITVVDPRIPLDLPRLYRRLRELLQATMNLISPAALALSAALAVTSPGTVEDFTRPHVVAAPLGQFSVHDEPARQRVNLAPMFASYVVTGSGRAAEAGLFTGEHA